jgi:hypothetical protein
VHLCTQCAACTGTKILLNMCMVNKIRGRWILEMIPYKGAQNGMLYLGLGSVPGWRVRDIKIIPHQGDPSKAGTCPEVGDLKSALNERERITSEGVTACLSMKRMVESGQKR